MKKFFLPLAVFLSFCFVDLGVAKEVKTVNECVECHKDINDGSVRQREYHDWSQSSHAKAGVFCNDCHGGYADMKDKDIAHGGVRPGVDPQSKIHFQQIPETCGRCHRPEEEAFISSKHFKKLSTSGKGPNCVTCHTPKKGNILTSEEVRFLCAECHNAESQYSAKKLLNVPADAQDTLTLFEKLQIKVTWLKDIARFTGHSSKEAKHLESGLKAARVDWHQFKLYDTQDSLRVLLNDADDVKSKLLKK